MNTTLTNEQGFNLANNRIDAAKQDLIHELKKHGCEFSDAKAEVRNTKTGKRMLCWIGWNPEQPRKGKRSMPTFTGKYRVRVEFDSTMCCMNKSFNMLKDGSFHSAACAEHIVDTMMRVKS